MKQYNTNISGYLSSDEFYSEVKRRIKLLSPNPCTLTLISLDFDNFNYINDMFGFETGDLVLEKITEHFSMQLHEDEIFSRLHADHFLFCLYTLEASDIANRFLNIAQLNNKLANILPTHYSLVTSGGSVTVPDDTMPLSALLDQANYARKRAKGKSVSNIQFYDKKMSDEVHWQKIVTCTMKSALKNREFEMYLQPKVLVRSSQIVGAEALARWNSPQYGFIFPDQFIPIMEQNGFICQLDFFILEEACRFIKDNTGKEITVLPISVNFSKAHLNAESLAERIFQTVNRLGVSTRLIEIEFTENLFIGDYEKMIEIITDLKLLGFKVSLDDFGSAYSSLNCLKELPVDMIKIDKGFLNTSTDTEKGRIILTKMVELIKSLHLLSVMEGIETNEQVEFLQNLNCDLGQGYFYAKPMPVPDFINYLQSASVLSDFQSFLTVSPKNADNPCIHVVPQEFQKDEDMHRTLNDKINELETVLASERSINKALHLSEERYRVIVEQNDDIMFDWDFESDQITFSEKYTILFGMPPITENLTKNSDIRRQIHEEDLPEFEQWIHHTYRKSGFTTSQFRIKDANGNDIWICSRSTAICNETDMPSRAVGVFSNINAQKKQLDILTMKSQRDPLTKLLNKGEICERVRDVLTTASSQSGAFFIVDIDNFKGLNDNLGHQFGDAVLVSIADKIRKLFRETDSIGRIGGDEFAVYMCGCNEPSVHLKAEQLALALRNCYYGSSKKYNISGSVGVALYPKHGQTYEDLYRLADAALYESKHRGKDQFTIFHKNLPGDTQDGRTPVDYSNGFLRAYFQSDFPFRIFQMLYETVDFRASVQMVLELLGKQYQVDRVYVFQSDNDFSYLNNTYEWCAKGIDPQIDSMQHLSIESLGFYPTHYNKEGIFCCSDIHTLDKMSYDICAPQGIKSMLHCAINNEGNINGLIGFDMCSDYHDWTGEEIAILSYISRILSVFLVKTKTASELQTSYKNCVEMVDNLYGYVYVIDPKTYELLYINNATKSLGLTLDQYCYKMAFGIDTPCPNCPIRKLSDTVHFANEEIYSEILNCWINSAASKMKWEGVKDAVLVCCTDISKYKNNKPDSMI